MTDETRYELRKFLMKSAKRLPKLMPAVRRGYGLCRVCATPLPGASDVCEAREDHEETFMDAET